MMRRFCRPGEFFSSPRIGIGNIRRSVKTLHAKQIAANSCHL
jgi:hypothetical protein